MRKSVKKNKIEYFYYKGSGVEILQNHNVIQDYSVLEGIDVTGLHTRVFDERRLLLNSNWNSNSFRFYRMKNTELLNRTAFLKGLRQIKLINE